MTSSVPDVPNHGEVFTRRWVVEVLLDLTGYTGDRDLGQLRLLEPSCGSGAFLKPAVERLIVSAQRHGRELASLGDAVRAYDLQAGHVQTCRVLCGDLLTAAGVPASVASSLAEGWVRQADFLLSGLLGEIEGRPEVEDHLADVIIGNPPYIRYDDLADDIVTLYRNAWPTMQGRGDIYIGFIERSLRMLRPAGRIGFICADRWMRNAYGAALRKLITSRYAVEHIWAMHDVDAFEVQVSAYPAITVLGNHPQGPVVVADTTAAFRAASAATLTRVVRDQSFTQFSGTGVTAHRLPHWFGSDEFWPTGSPARLALLENLNDRFGSLHDPLTGTRVSIGVASGADKVYVTKDSGVAEPDRMLPLATREDLASGRFDWQGNYLVNPWTDSGSLVPLANYPRLATYLSQHPVLRTRHVARKAPDTWYRTIDKVQAKLTSRPKLLLQDLKAHIDPVLEPGGHYPHHNLYYVVSDVWDMEVLGGLLLSRIAQAFVEAYCVRMNGGTLRFQAQYLRRIRVPRPSQIDPAIGEALRTAFRARDTDAATQAAAIAYGIDLREYDLVPPRGRERVA